MYIYRFYMDLQISQVEIPTGLPMLFDPRVKRIRLFEDEAETQSLFTKHNFGSYSYPCCQFKLLTPIFLTMILWLMVTGTRPDLLFKPEFMSDEEFQDLVQLEGAGSTGSQ